MSNPDRIVHRVPHCQSSVGHLFVSARRVEQTTGASERRHSSQTWLLLAFLVVALAGCASRRDVLHVATGEMHLEKVLEHRVPSVPLRRQLHIDIGRPIITLAAVGDIMLAGSAAGVLDRQGADYPFDSTRTYLTRADVAIGNLEAPFTARGQPFDKKFTFRMSPALASGIRNAGFDVLNLANNHVLDYGPEGLFDTTALLDSLGIGYCGVGANDSLAAKCAVVDVSGTKVAFLGFSMTFPEAFWASSSRPGTCFATEPRLQRAIESALCQADYVVVSFHWGAELMTHPKAYQRYFAHKAIDLGADLVLGHHAHVLQGLEVYRGRLIAYGLGNFAFGSYSRNVVESMILEVYLGRQGLLFARAIPLLANNYEVSFQPRPLRGEGRLSVLERLSEISAALAEGEALVSRSGVMKISTTSSF